MLIILEGPDRTGKSTLAHALRDRVERLYPRHRVELFHAGPPKLHPLDEYERPLMHYRPSGSRHVICDRWHVGEQVYPKVCGRPTSLTHSTLAHIESFLMSRGAIIVHVHTDLDVMRRRLLTELEERGTVPFTWEQVNDSHHLFNIELKTSSLPVVSVDTGDGQDISAHVEAIIKMAITVETTAAGIRSLHTYVGPAWPDALVIGDVRHRYRDMHINPDVAVQAARDPSPAFMPYPSTSGEYLMDALNPLALPSKIGLLNANDVDNPYLAWIMLGRPPAVALGRRAYETVKSWAIGAVPHPQYVRRFMCRHVDWYRTLLGRAMVAPNPMAGNLLAERPEGFWGLQSVED